MRKKIAGVKIKVANSPLPNHNKNRYNVLNVGKRVISNENVLNQKGKRKYSQS